MPQIIYILVIVTSMLSPPTVKTFINATDCNAELYSANGRSWCIPISVPKVTKKCLPSGRRYPEQPLTENCQ